MRLIQSNEGSIATKEGYESSYGLDIINAKYMWQNGFTGKNVKIAVIDTGCDINHEVFNGKIVHCRNFTSEGGENDVTDGSGHGTHVAGIITSVAKDSELIVVKVLDSTGNGNYDNIINGIKYATSIGVDIISMSLGGLEHSVELRDAIDNALNRNIVVVCAAGNIGDNNADTDECCYPGAYNQVIEVGAIDKDYSVAPFSNSNKDIDVVAPGKDIVSTYPNNQYAILSGTSMATPFVSGCMALLKEYFRSEFGREMTESELYSQLIKNTKTMENINRTQQGNGYVKLCPSFSRI